ncbi:AMP-binding protein [Albimonas sp. CAU 1670]|uniref:AMP-binding protein n=1 Tax=Albimonas sp. CAU 1670 TaxID=3032599 RepID=UPI0023DB3097|nr:AMP-binding protein [Albimonas sp. CAU 1670]MDF2234091.1 AMP-binding protein [Albimonas sp. CAU 1670]
MPRFAAELARLRPDETALADPARALGWGEVDDVLNRIANGLAALEIPDGRRVAVFAENAVETALANLGGLIAGLSVTPVNFHLTAEEAAYILETAKVSVLFVDAKTADRGLAAAQIAGVPTVIGWHGAPAPVLDFETWLAAQSGAPCAEDHPPRPNLLFTSGTTGRPKAVELPPTMFAGGATISDHLAALGQDPRAPLGKHLVVGPMYHTGPLSGARLLAAGTPSVILGRFDAEAVLAAIETHRIGTTVMVPTHFVRLLALPREVRAKYDVSSLQRVNHTGAKCPVEVKRAMIEWWGPVLVEAYGATEIGTTNSIDSHEWLARPGSVGKAQPPFRNLVLDEDGNEVPPGTEGRLCFVDETGRGPIYHDDPEKTAVAYVKPGVFTIGEIAFMDDDGYVFITDRFSDMVVSGGVNIYPAEAENVLIDHPGVADVACVAAPHPEMGEELVALIVPEDPAAPPDPDEVIAWCRARLSTFKCPRRAILRDDLGRNAMGKLNKRALKAPFWAAEKEGAA